jgi:hypothetical protein
MSAQHGAPRDGPDAPYHDASGLSQNLRRRAARDPVQNIRRMESFAANAEPLRLQQPTPVGP